MPQNDTCGVCYILYYITIKAAAGGTEWYDLFMLSLHILNID